MIFVTILNQDNKVKGFEITGHANYDEHGSDIVCSAVTILAYSCVNTLDKHCSNINFQDDDEIMIVKTKEHSESISIIFDYFITGINTLLGNYNEYVQLNYKETLDDI